MSYILDALRRADAQRGRGAVPGLDSQHVVDPDPENEHPRSRAPLWLAVGLLLGLAVPGVAFWMGRGASAPMPPAPRPMAVASLPTPSSSPAVASLPTPSSSPAAASLPTPSSSPAAASLPTPLPAPAAAPSSAPTPAPAPTSAPAPAEAPRPAPARVEAPPPPPAPAPAPVRAPAPAPARPAPSPAPVAVAPAPAPRPAAAPAPAPLAAVPRLQDLPDSLRSQLPSLSLGGLIYSSTPADRIVIVNGQPYREGDPVGRDLVVEEILPRAAVMRWRDQRYQLTY